MIQESAMKYHQKYSLLYFGRRLKIYVCKIYFDPNNAKNLSVIVRGVEIIYNILGGASLFATLRATKPYKRRDFKLFTKYSFSTIILLHILPFYSNSL